MGVCVSEDEESDDESGMAKEIADELNRLANLYTEKGQEITPNTLQTLTKKMVFFTKRG